MDWELFDPDDEMRITVGRLPHWYQPGRLYFITFRTDDSLPTSVIKLWLDRRDDWLRRQGIDPRSADWQAQVASLPVRLRQRFHAAFSEEYLTHLDRGHGECVLKRREISEIVKDGLLYFNESRYQLTDFVVMPNHVHILAGLTGDTDILRQCFSWKKNSALRINKVLGRRGRFWHAESFDHLVRNERQFEMLREYIMRNPEKAGLCDTDFIYWRKTDVDA